MNINTNECLLYAGSINTDGYGIILSGGKQYRVHRVMYENYTGKNIDGLYSDHLCRVRSCINPDHIEPVDNVTNIMRGEAPSAKNARKTHCNKGHDLTSDNIHVRNNGWRICKACHADWQRAYRAKVKARNIT